MACKCNCCLGACCVDGACSMQTFTDCVAACGKWQGAGVPCEDGECPCDPPADAVRCQKCQDGSVYPVGAGDCWDSVREEKGCFSCGGSCGSDGSCPRGCKCVEGKCVRCVQACCGECSTENPSPPTCACVDGQSVPTSCCLPEPIQPCCPTFLLVSVDDCEGGTTQTSEVQLFFGVAGISQTVTLENLPCCESGACGLVCRVRASCQSRVETCGTECSLLIEYFDGNDTWSDTVAYAAACDCLGHIQLSVEQRDEGYCGTGEPEGEPAPRYCTDSCLSSAECVAAGGVVVSGQTCEDGPCGCSGPCDEENPCPEGCACVDGECVAGTEYCWVFEAYPPVGSPHGGYWCTQGESNAAAQAAANEGGCEANSFLTSLHPECVFKAAYAGTGALVFTDPDDPECPDNWMALVTCCYTCPDDWNPLP